MSATTAIQAPRGRVITCKGWHQEAALRMIHNNLDPEVAEKPDQLIVYGGTGRAARDWPSFHAIVRSLESLENDETLLVQSGRPVGIFRTHPEAPRVLLANANLVGHWSNFDEFTRLDRMGLTMYGQMTAGSWIYIGSQGIVQGTYETFAVAGAQAFRRLAGRPAGGLGRHGRHGRRAAAGRHHERRLLPGRRGGPAAHRAPARHGLLRPHGPQPGRGPGDGGAAAKPSRWGWWATART